MKNLFAIAAIVLGTLSFSACGGNKEGEATTTDSTTIESTMTDTASTMTTDTASTMTADTSAADSTK